MTYKELALKIFNMTVEQQETDVTVFDSNTEEYYPVECISYTTKKVTDVLDEFDVLDENHPILIL